MSSSIVTTLCGTFDSRLIRNYTPFLSLKKKNSAPSTSPTDISGEQQAKESTGYQTSSTLTTFRWNSLVESWLHRLCKIIDYCKWRGTELYLKFKCAKVSERKTI